MFHTLGYKGHYIQVAIQQNKEEIKAQIIFENGRFKNIKCKSVIGAKQVISKYVNKHN